MNSKYDNEVVSVIMPAYNAERFIALSIDSVLKQTYSNIELIIVDDCSNDKTGQIVKRYLSEYGNIKYYLLEKNSGAGISRKTGVEYALGRYIAFLDSDDTWNKEKLERQIAILKKYKADFSYTGMNVIDENGNSLNRIIHVKESADYKLLQKNTMIATSTVLIDRMQMEKFQMSDRRHCEDYATWLALLRNGRTAYGIDEPLTNYREVKNSLSSKHFRSMKNVWLTQVEEENINPIKATINILFYAWNSFKKHYL